MQAMRKNQRLGRWGLPPEGGSYDAMAEATDVTVEATHVTVEATHVTMEASLSKVEGTHCTGPV